MFVRVCLWARLLVAALAGLYVSGETRCFVSLKWSRANAACFFFLKQSRSCYELNYTVQIKTQRKRYWAEINAQDYMAPGSDGG